MNFLKMEEFNQLLTNPGAQVAVESRLLSALRSLTKLDNTDVLNASSPVGSGWYWMGWG